MAKSKNLKKLLFTAGCMLTLLTGSMSMCFAADAGTDSAKTDVYVNITATTIDFSVTESISLEGTANSTDLSEEDVVVKNNNNVGVLSISKVSAEAADGWTLTALDTDWAKLNADAKKIGLQADGTKDLSTGDYTAAGTIAPGESDTTKITGKTGMVTSDTNVQAATVTVTVALN